MEGVCVCVCVSGVHLGNPQGGGQKHVRRHLGGGGGGGGDVYSDQYSILKG